MDSYGILGVGRNATMEEINAAFKRLMDKYSEDKYINNPLSDLAAQKRRDIEAAYDAIIKERAKKEKENKEADSYNNGSFSDTDNSGQSQTSSEYQQIRSYINTGNIIMAERMLQETQTKDAEWYYLSGLVAMRRGLYNDAYNYIKTATNKEPQNQEYRAAFMRMEQQASGYRGMNGGMQQDQCCNCCTNLVIADCCCECLGGDLISCC